MLKNKFPRYFQFYPDNPHDSRILWALASEMVGVGGTCLLETVGVGGTCLLEMVGVGGTCLLEKEGVTNHLEVCRHGWQYDGESDGRFVVPGGTWSTVS